MISNSMARIISSRRAILGLTGIIACVIICIVTGENTSWAISGIVASVAGANAAQQFSRGRNDQSEGAIK